MENSYLKRRILFEIENLITTSCPKKNISLQFESLHVAILKKYYNASEVSIDYHRRRIEMEIIMSDTEYDPKTVNLYMHTLHANLWFRNLSDFLKSCIDKDNKSLAFYSSLLSSYRNSDRMLTFA